MDYRSNVFQQIEEIKEYIESFDITLIDTRVNFSPAVCYRADDFEAIAIDIDVPMDEYAFYVVHEFEHLIHDCVYYSGDDIEVKKASETKVCGYAIRRLFPVRDLKKALSELKVPTLEDLAEKFGASPRIIKTYCFIIQTITITCSGLESTERLMIPISLPRRWRVWRIRMNSVKKLEFKGIPEKYWPSRSDHVDAIHAYRFIFHEGDLCKEDFYPSSYRENLKMQSYEKDQSSYSVSLFASKMSAEHVLKTAVGLSKKTKQFGVGNTDITYGVSTMPSKSGHIDYYLYDYMDNNPYICFTIERRGTDE